MGPHHVRALEAGVDLRARRAARGGTPGPGAGGRGGDSREPCALCGTGLSLGLALDVGRAPADGGEVAGPGGCGNTQLPAQPGTRRLLPTFQATAQRSGPAWPRLHCGTSEARVGEVNAFGKSLGSGGLQKEGAAHGWL